MPYAGFLLACPGGTWICSQSMQNNNNIHFRGETNEETYPNAYADVTGRTGRG